MKPFSQASENNQLPILNHLEKWFVDVNHVLEVGSGTGQHAACFSRGLPHLTWQPSDRSENIEGIRMWIEDGGPNCLAPLELDVVTSPWPHGFDAVFSANTAHIMPWSVLQSFVADVAENLPEAGVFVLYGPFKYEGEFTSQSNAQFDARLKQANPLRGIRDFEEVNAIAQLGGLRLIDDEAMPANNQLLRWQKLS